MPVGAQLIDRLPCCRSETGHVLRARLNVNRSPDTKFITGVECISQLASQLAKRRVLAEHPVRVIEHPVLNQTTGDGRVLGRLAVQAIRQEALGFWKGLVL